MMILMILMTLMIPRIWTWPNEFYEDDDFDDFDDFLVYGLGQMNFRR